MSLASDSVLSEFRRHASQVGNFDRLVMAQFCDSVKKFLRSQLNSITGSSLMLVSSK